MTVYGHTVIHQLLLKPCIWLLSLYETLKDRIIGKSIASLVGWSPSGKHEYTLSQWFMHPLSHTHTHKVRKRETEHCRTWKQKTEKASGTETQSESNNWNTYICCQMWDSASRHERNRDISKRFLIQWYFCCVCSTDLSYSKAFFFGECLQSQYAVFTLPDTSLQAYIM